MSKEQIFNFAKDFSVPLAKEEVDKSKDIVNWGKDNLYAQWLNFIYYKCALHQSIVNGKVFYTISAGIKETASNRDIIKLVDRALPNLDLNLEISNSYYALMYLEPTNRTIVKVKHVPYEWVRVTEDGGFKVSQDWTDNTIEPSEYSDYASLGEGLVFMYQFKVEPMQTILEVGKKDITYNYYPTVPYSGAINSILTDIEITNYQLSEVVNNFSLGTILSLNNGQPKTQSDREDIEDRILDTATGADNAGGIFITFSNGKDTEPSVVHLNGNQLHERYISVSENVRDNILLGHGVSPELFGVDTDGNFNADNLDMKYWLMNGNYIKNRRNQLLELVNFVAEVNGVNEEIMFNDVIIMDSGAETNIVGEKLNAMSPLLANSVVRSLTVNEIRAIAGLPPVEGGDTIDTGTAETFSKQAETDKILDLFGKIGRSKDDFTFLASEPKNDRPFLELFKSGLKQKQITVLNLIEQGESFNEISKATGINKLELSLIYNKLRRGEHIDKDYKVTEKGKLAIVSEDSERMSIVYSYEVKSGYGDDIIANTRDFCRTLVNANKVYTREEIDSISAAVGADVWRYRGGWYHNPNTDKNEPACRHFWQQNVIFN